MKNKKGAEMTIGTIVIIILALVVLVVIIYGFSTGWGDLWDKITGYGGGKVNVQTHVSACELSCSSGLTYDYCSKQRKVIFAEGQDAESLTCQDLAKKVPSVGLSECGSITCEQAIYRCTDIELKNKVCLSTDGDNCRVQCMSKNSYDRRKRGEYEEGEEKFIKLNDLSNLIRTDDTSCVSGEICVVAVPEA